MMFGIEFGGRLSASLEDRSISKCPCLTKNQQPRILRKLFSHSKRSSVILSRWELPLNIVPSLL